MAEIAIGALAFGAVAAKLVRKLTEDSRSSVQAVNDVVETGRRFSSEPDGEREDEKLSLLVRNIILHMKKEPFPGAGNLKKALKNKETPDEAIVWSVAAEKLTDDYRKMSNSKGTMGGLLIVCERFGSGKSYGLQVLCRSQSLRSPKKYAFFRSGVASNGDAYFDRLLEYHGLPSKTSPTVFARDLAIAVEEAEETDSIFKIPIGGTFYSSECQYDLSYQSDRRPVVVFEDLNPEELMGPWGEDDITSLGERIKHDRAVLGKALVFFGELMVEAYNNKFVVFVTTRSKRVADCLQRMNGGQKAQIAPSLFQGRSRGRVLDLAQFPDLGFGWNSESRKRFLLTRFADELNSDPPKLSRDLIQIVAGDTDSIRDAVGFLQGKVSTPTKLPRSRTEETADLDMEDDEPDLDH